MFGGKLFKNAYILSFIDHFHFIHPVDGKLRPLFGRAGHPVDSCRQGACTVGFDGHILTCLVQTVDQFIVYPQGRFAARKDNGDGRIFFTSAIISSSVIIFPSSCCVSQKSHFRLQPENVRRWQEFRYGSLRPASCKRFH